MREVLATSQFEQIFRLAVSDMHAQLERGDDQLQLNLDAMLPILRSLVAKVSGGLANQIPDSAGLPSITVVRKDQVPQVWFGVQVTREASWVFPLLMLLAFAAAIAIARAARADARLRRLRGGARLPAAGAVAQDRS